MFKQSLKEEWHKFRSSKMTFIVLFIIPILTVLMLGVEFQSEVINQVPMAVIDYDRSTLSRQLIDSFSSNDTFNVCYYPQSEEELETLMSNSDIRVGMIIPRHFYQAVQGLNSPTVLMVYNGSHMSITSVTKSKAMEILLTYKAGATMNHLMSRLNMSYDEAYQVTQAFQFSNRMLYNPSKSFEDFLAPIFMAGLVQSALALTASISVNHDIFLRERKKRWGYTTGKIVFYSLMGTLSMMSCVLIQVYFYQVTFIGSLVDVLGLTIAFSFAVSSFSVVISTLIRNRMISLIGGGVCFIPNSVMAGSTWPLLVMPIGYQSFGKLIPFIHYVTNLRAIYLKGFALEQMTKDVKFLVTFGIGFVIINEVVMRIAMQESAVKALVIVKDEIQRHKDLKLEQEVVHEF